MIYLGADHRGFELKEKIKSWLSEWGYAFEDLGNVVYDPQDDYPQFAVEVARKVSAGKEDDRGIVLCGSGVGVDIVANKFRGVRCALVWSDGGELVRQSREHDGANVLALPADYLTESQARKIVKLWLELPGPSQERHKRRVAEIGNIESALYD
jgi:ribose 5-phosphate isomerase B